MKTIEKECVDQKGDALLVADAGGTKTEWLYIAPEADEGVLLTTDGINGSIMTEEAMTSVIDELNHQLKRINAGEIDCELYFYGAGCNSELIKERLDNIFSSRLSMKFSKKEFHSDLEGAARALFGDSKGIAAILGTGSATGFYSGRSVTDNVPSLGYILGDEGSGASMGKDLLNMLFKRELPKDIKEELEKEKDIDLPHVIENTYRRKDANRYLASFVPFIKYHENVKEISELIDRNLKLFFDKNVLKYKNEPNKSIRFAGSVAVLFSNRLEKLAEDYGFKAEKFLKNPITGLGNYYLTKRKNDI